MGANMFWNQFISLSASISFSFLIGCSSNWLPNSILYVTDPHHKPFLTLDQCTYVATCNELGKTLSTLPGGYFSAKFGRKKILVYMLLVNFISWIILCSCSSVMFVCLARFLAGSAEGLFNIVGSISAAELAPPKYRSTFSSIFSVAFNFGLLFEALLSALFGSYEMLVAVNTALSLCSLPTVYWFLESPYYLAHVRNYEKGEANLRKVRGGCSEEEVRSEWNKIKESVAEANDDNGDNRSWSILKRKSVRKAMLCAILISCLPSLTGNVQIRLYVSVVLPSNEFVPNTSYPLVFVVVAFSGSLVSIFVVRNFPRRLLSINSNLMVCMVQSVNGVFGFLYYRHHRRNDVVAWKWIFLAGNLTYIGLHASTAASLNDTIRAEIIPYTLKGIGNSACLILRSLAIIASYKLFIYVQKELGLYVNYAFFATMAALSCVTVYELLPETADKSLADLQNDLNESKKSKKTIEKY